MIQLSHPYMMAGKTIVLTRWTFVGKVMILFFIMLSMLVIVILTRSKRLFISWPQSPSTVILEPKNIKSVTVSIVSPSICHEVMRLDIMIFVFWMLSFKPAFSLSSFTFIKRLFSSLLSAIRVVSSAYLRLLLFLLTILIPVLSGLHFYNRRKNGERTRSSSSSFLNRHHASMIISSSSRLGRGVSFCPYMVKPGLSWCNGKIILSLSTIRVFHF